MVIFSMLLAAAGLALCVVMICAASHMPPRSSWLISLLVAGAFALSVGVVVTSISGDIESAFKFFCGTAIAMLGQVLWRFFHGLRPLDFIDQTRGRDANQH